MRAKSLTDADGEGKDPQKLGGHSDRRMTERYIRSRRIVSAEPPTMPEKEKKR